MARKRAVILIARTGAGKLTQAKKLARYGFPHYDMGEYLRSFRRRQDHPLAKEVLTIVDRGDHLEDPMLCQVFREMVREVPRDSPKILLDGIPRSVGQAKEALTVLDALDFDQPTVLVLDAPREVCYERLVRRGEVEGRVDDQTKEAIVKRLDYFDEKVVPTIDYCQSVGLAILQVNGHQHEDLVHTDIIRKLEESWAEEERPFTRAAT